MGGARGGGGGTAAGGRAASASADGRRRRDWTAREREARAARTWSSIDSTCATTSSRSMPAFTQCTDMRSSDLERARRLRGACDAMVAWWTACLYRSSLYFRIARFHTLCACSLISGTSGLSLNIERAFCHIMVPDVRDALLKAGSRKGARERTRDLAKIRAPPGCLSPSGKSSRDPSLPRAAALWHPRGRPSRHDRRERAEPRPRRGRGAAAGPRRRRARRRDRQRRLGQVDAHRRARVRVARRRARLRALARAAPPPREGERAHLGRDGRAARLRIGRIAGALPARATRAASSSTTSTDDRRLARLSRALAPRDARARSHTAHTSFPLSPRARPRRSCRSRASPLSAGRKSRAARRAT